MSACNFDLSRTTYPHPSAVVSRTAMENRSDNAAIAHFRKNCPGQVWFLLING
jgi:hypothetical protein